MDSRKLIDRFNKLSKTTIIMVVNSWFFAVDNNLFEDDMSFIRVSSVSFKKFC